MSDPYVYTPRVNYRNSPYLAPFYTQQYSPFVPPISLNNSPFSPNVSLPPSPHVMNSPLPGSPFIPNNIPFPHDPDEEDYLNPYVRPRTVSWNGGAVPPTLQNTAWLQSQHRPQRRRSRSDAGYFEQPQVVNINNGYWVSPGTPYGPFSQLPAVPQLSLHPYLDGHNLRGDIVFDLSAPYFTPMRMVGGGQTTLITSDELNQAATHPPIYSLKIICDLIPNWPIDMSYNPSNRYSAVAPPIKLGDVLSAIWNSLRLRISQANWASLTPQQVHLVSRAYTARCREMGALEMNMMNEGVKKIDFLLGKKWFRGLVRTGDGVETLKLNVA
ncbi:hypothetical protein BDZ97DRAFT_1915095 [Flammula alnicola]|nr:hypothetical protein BDZ97DRAFT_1915095 [Flammula alnicola]